MGEVNVQVGYASILFTLKFPKLLLTECSLVRNPSICVICTMFKIGEKQVRAFAIFWLVLISVLFFLPGSALPKEDWLGDIYFDKWVHCGFFVLLLLSWRFYFPDDKKYSWVILLLALVYGFGVELIQHYLVANRSFDLLDVVADMAGAVAGILCWRWYKKNRPL
ncbi:MAG: VanZ family protein [Chitinophagaceae bacterium]|nr:MAG: VanZ family protein [Chitinophagaceae bacterium]